MVISNILVNASQAMSGKGNICVQTSKKENGIEITITDTGPGIQDDIISKIFEPLISSKTTGTGLGLAISKRLVYAHKGTITVKNEEGGGATFTIFLPDNLRRD
jgi:two-component system NtrC family sensor kinase